MKDAEHLMGIARDELQRVYGYPSFRPGQEDILRSVFAGEDVLAVMPTGSGKSLLFQLPALARQGLTIVVSPLIALMRDQVAQLKELGVSAAALNSATDASERARIRDGLEDRSLRLLYVAPERLCRDDTLEFLSRYRVDLYAIDEAHCVSQWGHDFRPEYLRLKDVGRAFDNPPVIAVTATADEPTRDEIVERLFPRKPNVVVRSFDRPNLFLAMRPKADATRQLREAIRNHPGESGIIYCASRRRTEELAAELSRDGIKSLPYHAGLPQEQRSSNQDVFLQQDGVVMCATIAFGMGVDKPDVRFVFHADMPSSIEGYYQEIGRAGRDGLPADTLTLYGAGDIELRRRQIEEGNSPDERKQVERRKLDDLVTLCESARCRRQVLLGMFGEACEPCGHCDVCKGMVRLVDGSLEAQKALSAIMRTSGRFFFGHLVNILTGNPSDAVERHKHNELKTFGVGKDRSASDWRGVFRQLLSSKLIEHDRMDRDRLIVTEAGRLVLRGAAPFQLREDALKPKPKARRDSKLPPTPHDDDLDLIDSLKALRAAMARAAAQPAYVIFPDRTLIEMARARPKSLDDLSAVHGVGAAKLQKYGAAFLAVIKDHKGALELPEVETVRRGLQRVFEGALIAEVETRRPNLRFPFPAHFVARLEGRRVTALGRRAKYLLAALDSGETLVMHLGMSGSFRIEDYPLLPQGEKEEIPGAFVYPRSKISSHDHVVFRFGSGARVIYNDPRRFGFMTIVETDKLDAHPLFDGLGVEPLSDAFDVAHLVGLLKGVRAPLKSALLDQRRIAGLGNIYVCEALHRARLSPLMAAGDAPRAKVKALHGAIRQVLEEAIKAGGSTLRDHRQADGELGYFQHSFAVYDHEGAACTNKGCRGTIARIVQTGRSTFYCPTCQK